MHNTVSGPPCPTACVGWGSILEQVRGGQCADGSVRGRRRCGPGAASLATAAAPAVRPTRPPSAHSTRSEKGDIAALPLCSLIKGCRLFELELLYASFICNVLVAETVNE